MIDRSERVNVRIARRVKFVEAQLALERGKDAKVGALQVHRRLSWVDELDARDCPQDFCGAFHDGGYAWAKAGR
jgi:hypothetical protein